MSTQRLDRSSVSPRLRFPPAKKATADTPASTIASATNGGCEKYAWNPPQPVTASPRYASIPARTDSALAGLSRMVSLLLAGLSSPRVNSVASSPSNREDDVQDRGQIPERREFSSR